MTEDAYCINFIHCENIEICISREYNRRLLTHIFISILRVYESRWTSRSYSISTKSHKLCSILSSYFTTNKKRELIISSSEDEEEEKENIIKQTKKKYKKLESAKKIKVPKLVSSSEKTTLICVKWLWILI